MLFLFCFVLFCRFYTFTFLEILHWNMSKHKTSLIKCFWSICLNPCSSKPRYQFSLTIRVTGIQLQFLHYWPHNKLYFLRYWCGMLTSDRYDHIHFLCSAGLFCEFTFTHNWSSHLKLLSNNPCVQYLHHRNCVPHASNTVYRKCLRNALRWKAWVVKMQQCGKRWRDTLASGKT